MAAYNDILFNEADREFDSKVLIYFDELIGTEITKEDYLIDFNILEEMWEDSGTVMGSVSANTLDLTLRNENRRFTPTNMDGPYSGKIKLGIKIEVYIKLIKKDQAFDWLQLGTFYVTDWQAGIDGITAAVYASDKLQQVFDADTVAVEVVQEYTYKQFLEYYFQKIGYTVTVNDSLTDILHFGWSEESTTFDIDKQVQAALAACYCDRADNILVVPLIRERALRATLTDSDQIITVTSDKSIIKSYDGVKLTYYVPKLKKDTELINVPDVDISAGLQTHDTLAFDDGPVVAVEHVGCQTKAILVMIASYKYTPWSIDITTNSAQETKTNLIVYGTKIDFVETILSDDKDNMYEYNNKFLQDATYATTFKRMLSKFVESEVPIIEVEIRGNPLLLLGDKVRIISPYYATDFTGIIIKQKTKYSGGLSAILTLISADIFDPQGIFVDIDLASGTLTNTVVKNNKLRLEEA